MRTHARSMHALALPLLVALGIAFAPPAVAQDPPAPATSASEAKEAETAGASDAIEVPRDRVEVDVPIDILKLRILPLRRDELAKVAVRWVDELQAVVERLTRGEIALRSLTGDERSKQLRLNIESVAAREYLIARTRVILERLALKGGDVAELQAYVNAVSTPTVDVRNTEAVLRLIAAWLRSPEGGMKALRSLVAFALTLGIAWMLARFISRLASRALDRLGYLSTLLREFLVRSIRRVILAVGLVVALSSLGVPLAPLMATIGAVGLVVGLALQNTLSNFASGLLILLYRPFDVGNFVTVGGVTGKVESLSLMTTSLVTPDNQSIVMPNNTVWGGIITNISGRTTRRVDMTFGVAYGTDVDRARAVLLDIVKGHPMVLADPEPNIQVAQLADSSVNILVRPWTRTDDYWTVLWEITAEVKRRFDAEGISIPFPQREVWMRTTT